MNASATTQPPMTFMSALGTAMGAYKAATSTEARTSGVVSDAEMVRAAVISGRKGKIDDIRNEMETAARVADQIVKESGVKGPLNKQQIEELTAKVKENSEYREAAKHTQKDQTFGTKTAVGGGILSAITGATGFVAGGILGLAAKAVALPFGAASKVNATAVAKTVGKWMAAAVALPVTALVGASSVRTMMANSKRSSTMDEMVKIAVEKSARNAGMPAAPVAPAAVAPTVAQAPAQVAAKTETAAHTTEAAAVVGTATAAALATAAAARSSSNTATTGLNSAEVARKAVEDAKMKFGTSITPGAITPAPAAEAPTAAKVETAAAKPDFSAPNYAVKNSYTNVTYTVGATTPKDVAKAAATPEKPAMPVAANETKFSPAIVTGSGTNVTLTSDLTSGIKKEEQAKATSIA